jgi:hypothetical protein
MRRSTGAQGPWSGTLCPGPSRASCPKWDPLTCDPDNVCTGTRDVRNLLGLGFAGGVFGSFKNTSIAVGIRNLFDTNPPFVIGADAFQAGLRPRVCQPARPYVLRAADVCVQMMMMNGANLQIQF